MALYKYVYDMMIRAQQYNTVLLYVRAGNKPIFHLTEDGGVVSK